jgi:hypothetical protein
MTTAQDVVRNTARRIGRLTPDAARAYLDRIRAEGSTANLLTVRELTGGYSSQSLNAEIIRRLAIRAGIIRRI